MLDRDPSMALRPDDKRAAALTPVSPKHVAPSLLSLVGILLSAAWLVGAPWVFALFALVFDALDGALARALNASTRFGANLDFTGDTLVAALTLARVGAVLGTPVALVVGLPALVTWQAWARTREVRVSGRAALVFVCLALEHWPRMHELVA
jgi:phosphatidylglycerophosphate synthase